jgi:hypothetical protein
VRLRSYGVLLQGMPKLEPPDTAWCADAVDRWMAAAPASVIRNYSRFL